MPIELPIELPIVFPIELLIGLPIAPGLDCPGLPKPCVSGFVFSGFVLPRKLEKRPDMSSAMPCWHFPGSTSPEASTFSEAQMAQ